MGRTIATRSVRSQIHHLLHTKLWICRSDCIGYQYHQVALGEHDVCAYAEKPILLCVQAVFNSDLQPCI